jgi:hypothetical protein
MKHLFKTFYSLLALAAVGVDLTQIVLFLVNQMSFRDPFTDDTFNALATIAQYGLFLCNVAAMKYFFRGAHFGLYLRKTFRNDLTWLFLVIFVIRFSDLILHKQNAPAGYAVHAIYLAGVFVKHLSRLMLLQILCAYRFQSSEKLQLFPVWKLLLYVSTNIIDSGANIARLTIFYVFQMATASASASPVTKAALIIFVGDMLYYYYNTRLISAFLLKIKNPGKDVLRFQHKESNVDLLSASVESGGGRGAVDSSVAGAAADKSIPLANLNDDDGAAAGGEMNSARA